MKRFALPILVFVMVFAAGACVPFEAVAPDGSINWLEVLPMQEIANALFALLAAFLVPVATQLTRAVTTWGNAKQAELTETQQTIFRLVVKSVVFAVEQGYAELGGEEKKEAAIAMAEQWLARLGMEVDLDILADEIEAVVWEEFKKFEL